MPGHGQASGHAGGLAPIPQAGTEWSASTAFGVVLLGQVTEDGVTSDGAAHGFAQQPFGQARWAPGSHSLHCRQNTTKRLVKFRAGRWLHVDGERNAESDGGSKSALRQT
jgi:hypothetical protein